MDPQDTQHPYHPFHPLYGCQLKIRRADEHFGALQNSMDAFFGRDPYEVIRGFDATSNQHVVRVKVRERPPHEWSPIIGDIVHNTRSALDHLVWQLVKRNGKEPAAGKTQFPIFSKDPLDRSLYDTTKQWRRALDKWNRQTEGMHPRDIAFLKELQPYQRTDAASHPLHRLRELSNWDKHRELHFAISAFVGPNFYLKEGTRNAAIQPVNVRPRGHVFEDGAEVARFEAVPYGPDPHVDVHVKVLCEVAFGEGSPLEGLGIKQTLFEIGQYVSEILLRFKIYFDGQMF